MASDFRTQEASSLSSSNQHGSAELASAALRPRMRLLFRRLAWWVGIPAALLLLAWFAPSIVARTGLIDVFLSRALIGSQGRITVGSAELGWFRPMVLTGVKLRDRSGNTLLTISRLSISKPLLSLLRDHSTLGDVVAGEPHLYGTLREDGSDWESFLQSLPAVDAPALSGRIEAIDGRATIEDRTIGRRWFADAIQAELVLPGGGEPLTAHAIANLAAGRRTAPLELDLQLPSASEGKEGVGELHVKAQNLPSLAFQSYLDRHFDCVQALGFFSGDLRFRWGYEGRPDNFDLEGWAQLDDTLLQCVWPRIDQLRLARLRVPLKLRKRGAQLEVEQGELECDFGHLQLAGRINLDAIAGDGRLAALAELARESFSVEGKVDLAKLAAATSQLLDVREGTELTGGQVRFALQSEPAPEVHRWHGELYTTQLTAVADGREIRWDDPLSAAVDVRQTGGGVRIQKAECRSEFLQLHASGTMEHLAATIELDLSRLADRLASFIELGEVKLAGSGRGELLLNRAESDRFAAEANLTARNFQFAWNPETTWVEDELSVRASASGKLAAAKRIASVDSGRLHLESGADRLELKLAEPAAWSALGEGVTLDASLQGNSKRWLARLRPWIAVGDLNIEGECVARSRVRIGKTSVALRDLDARLAPCRFDGYGLAIRENEASLRGSAHIDWAQGAVSLEDSRLTVGQLAADVAQLEINAAGGEPISVAGTVQAHGELALLQRLFQEASGTSPELSSGPSIAGELTADSSFAHQDGVTTGKLRLAVEKLRVSAGGEAAADPRSEKILWSEPQVLAELEGAYDGSQDELRIRRATVASQHAALRANGTVGDVQSTANLDLSGTVAYDWARIMPLLPTALQSEISISGADTARFAVSGPLREPEPKPPAAAASWAQRLAGRLETKWEKGRVFGLEMGGAPVTAQLAGGWLQTGRLDVPLSSGKLTVQPSARLAPGPWEVYLAKGPLLSNVKLTPEFCSRPIKYVAPLIASATRTEGDVSVELEGGRIPLADPARSDIVGTLSVHEAKMLPGPLARELMLIARQVEAIANREAPPPRLPEGESLLALEDQAIRFRLVEGRVYHEQFAARFGDAVLYTSGSVGLDQSLALAVDIPIREQWLRDERLRAALSGQVVRVPVAGTLAKPSIDRRSLQQLTAQMAATAARNLLRSELEGQLQKLFK